MTFKVMNTEAMTERELTEMGEAIEFLVKRGAEFEKDGSFLFLAVAFPDHKELERVLN